jgi:hypothetical protein
MRVAFIFARRALKHRNSGPFTIPKKFFTDKFATAAETF